MKKWLILVLVMVGMATTEEYYSKLNLDFADKSGLKVDEIKKIRQKYLEECKNFKMFKGEKIGIYRAEHFFDNKIDIDKIENLYEHEIDVFGGDMFFRINPPYLNYAVFSDIGIIGQVESVEYLTDLPDDLIYRSYYTIRLDSVVWDKGYLKTKPQYIKITTVSGRTLDGEISVYDERTYTIGEKIFLLASVNNKYYQSSLIKKENYIFSTMYAFDLKNNLFNIKNYNGIKELKSIYQMIDEIDNIFTICDFDNFLIKLNQKSELK